MTRPMSECGSTRLIVAFLDARCAHADIATMALGTGLKLTTLMSSLGWLLRTKRISRISRGVYTTQKSKRDFSHSPISISAGSISPPTLARLMAGR